MHSCDGGESFDNHRQTYAQGVQATGNNSLEVQALRPFVAFLCFKDFLASEDKDVEDGLTDTVERAVMVDVSVNHILTSAVQVQMYPLTHQVQARRHSADGYKHGPGQQTADVAHRGLSEHALCVRVLDLLPKVVNKTLTDWSFGATEIEQDELDMTGGVRGEDESVKHQQHLTVQLLGGLPVTLTF